MFGIVGMVANFFLVMTLYSSDMKSFMQLWRSDRLDTELGPPEGP